MSRELLTNFAMSLLASAMTATATSLTVTTGQGALFPTARFVVMIEQEVVLISSRTGDTLTVAARGFDGTTAVTHSVGVTVQHTVTAYTLNRLWQQHADTYHPDVPPKQAILGANGVPSGTASTYDNEFESVGSWTFSTATASGSFSIGSPLRSWLLYSTVANSTNNAQIYIPFTPSGSFTITCKFSDAFAYPLQSYSEATGCYFMVSDQADPTHPASNYNGVRIQLSSSSYIGTNNVYFRNIIAGKQINGTENFLGKFVQISPGMPVYVRLTYDGTNWSFFFGDGYTYNQIYTASGISLTPRSLVFVIYANSSLYMTGVDFVRVTLGSALPPYGQ